MAQRGRLGEWIGLGSKHAVVKEGRIGEWIVLPNRSCLAGEKGSEAERWRRRCMQG